MPLQVDRIDFLAQLSSIGPAWNNLLCELPHQSPFETFEWNNANLISFRNEGDHILLFRDDAQLIGILPLVLRNRRKYLRQRKWLECAGVAFADYGTFLARPGFELPVSYAFMEYLRSQSAFWHGVYLENLRAGSELILSFAAAAHQLGLFVVCRPTHRVKQLWANPCQSRNSPLQQSKSLARARRKLEGQGEVVFTVTTDQGEIHRQLEQYFKMHIERSRIKGVESPLSHSEHRAFFRNIVNSCAPAGQVWFSSLSCGGVPIACRFSMRYQASLHLYSTCFASGFSKYSPSMLQLDMLLQHAFANGIRVVDLGIGDSPQKDRAGMDTERELVTLELYHSREAFMESEIYAAARSSASRSSLILNTGKALRKVFPYQH